MLVLRSPLFLSYCLLSTFRFWQDIYGSNEELLTLSSAEPAWGLSSMQTISVPPASPPIFASPPAVPVVRDVDGTLLPTAARLAAQKVERYIVGEVRKLPSFPCASACALGPP